MSARPYLVHTFELSGDTGDITIAVERAGDPVELSIGSASWALPPGLCIAFGKMLAAAGHSSIDGKRRQAERAASLLTPNEARAEDRGLRIEGDVGAVTDHASGADTAADDDAVAFREHRLATAAGEG